MDYWDIFTRTGNITAYLAYKSHKKTENNTFKNTLEEEKEKIYVDYQG